MPAPLMGSVDESDFDRPLPAIDPHILSKTVRAVILAGGEQNNPLTRHRAMPALTLGSSVKLIDIPIQSCMAAGINKIYVLTQFQSQQLNSHIAATYPPYRFGGPDSLAWVDVLAAQQTKTQKEWYKGSADAVRRNLAELMDEARGVTPASDYVLLSGSAAYTLDVAQLVARHRERHADVTIAVHPVGVELAVTKGVTKVDGEGWVLDFVEKPSMDEIDGLVAANSEAGHPEFLASMGVYVFKRSALLKLLSAPAPDGTSATHIGHHVVPAAVLGGLKVLAHVHTGYWHDISSLGDFYDANLELTRPEAPLNALRSDGAAVARGSMLPPAQMHDAEIENAIVGDGAVLVGCTVRDSVIGECVYVGRGSVIERTVSLSNAVWASNSLRAAAEAEGRRVYGIGRDCLLRGVIVDENATIGDGSRLINKDGVLEADRTDVGLIIKDGIVVALRDSIVPAGTEV